MDSPRNQMRVKVMKLNVMNIFQKSAAQWFDFSQGLIFRQNL
jgi:hypothetical protein